MSGSSSYRPRAKLDPGAVVAIRLNSEKRSHADVAKQLKVNRTTVSRAMRRLTWRDVEP
jgi:IS30 family transposase